MNRPLRNTTATYRPKGVSRVEEMDSARRLMPKSAKQRMLAPQ